MVQSPKAAPPDAPQMESPSALTPDEDVVRTAESGIALLQALATRTTPMHARLCAERILHNFR